MDQGISLLPELEDAAGIQLLDMPAFCKGLLDRSGLVWAHSAASTGNQGSHCTETRSPGSQEEEKTPEMSFPQLQAHHLQWAPPLLAWQ